MTNYRSAPHGEYEIARSRREHRRAIAASVLLGTVAASILFAKSGTEIPASQEEAQCSVQVDSDTDLSSVAVAATSDHREQLSLLFDLRYSTHDDELHAGQQFDLSGNSCTILGEAELSFISLTDQ